MAVIPTTSRSLPPHLRQRKSRATFSRNTCSTSWARGEIRFKALRRPQTCAQTPSSAATCKGHSHRNARTLVRESFRARANPFDRPKFYRCLAQASHRIAIRIARAASHTSSSLQRRSNKVVASITTITGQIWPLAFTPVFQNRRWAQPPSVTPRIACPLRATSTTVRARQATRTMRVTTRASLS